MTLVLNAIPATLTEAVDNLEARLSTAERTWMLAMPRETTFEGLGPLSRPEWMLDDRDTPLVDWMIQQYGIVHPQDIGCLIMEALWSRLHQSKPLTMKLAAAARAHWRQQGRHPATLEQLPAEVVALMFPHELKSSPEAPQWPHLKAEDIRRHRPE